MPRSLKDVKINTRWSIILTTFKLECGSQGFNSSEIRPHLPLSKLEINARKFEKTRIRFNRDRKIGELSVPLKKSWLRLLFLC